jgi:ribose transport system permease protein
MTSETLTQFLGPRPKPGVSRPGRARRARSAPAAVTTVALVAILLVCGIMQSAVFSATGLTLVFSAIVPLAIATQAQMVIMAVGDIDLGIGSFVGLVTTVVATKFVTSPLLGALLLLALVAGYGLLGALVQLRGVPSLIATLGASFVWLGLGLFVLPTPGGEVPGWLGSYAYGTFGILPVPLLPIVAVAAAAWFVLQRTRFGRDVRGLGSNPTALERSGASPLAVRIGAYALAAVLGILAGLALAGGIGGGDVSASQNYTLITVASVILGGGSFFGGRAVAWGATAGAVTLGLTGTLLSLLDVSSSVQPAVQGALVIAALAGRLVIRKVVR